MASFAAKLEGLPAFPGSEPVEVPWFKQVEMKLGSTDEIETLGSVGHKWNMGTLVFLGCVKI